MRPKKINIYVADFETTSELQYNIEKETKVYLWGCKHINNENDFHKGLNIESFIKYITELNTENNVVYFHNLSFDGDFILWYLLRNKYECVEKPEDIDTSKKQFSCIITDEGTIFKIVVGLKEKIVEFRCSYRLFPDSIENIGTMVRMKKLSEIHDYKSIKKYDTIESVPENEWLYLEHDVEILRRIVFFLNEKHMLSISIATCAYKNWRKSKYLFQKENLIKSDNAIINEIIEKSYKGGLTKVNPEYAGVIIDKAISLDVNSLYPSIMYDNTMPIGGGRLFTNPKENNYPKQIIVVDVISAKVKKGLQAFIGSLGFSYTSYSYDNEFSNRTLYLWKDEFNAFEEIYEGEWDIIESVGFREANNVFKDYIDIWQHIKQHPSCEAERSWAKKMCNSLYGKFAMNDERYCRIPDHIEKDKIIYSTKESDTVYYYKPIASYITSMARVKIVNYITLNAERFLYCDTDSIYLKGWDVPSNIPIDPIKLGFFKLEHFYTKFKGVKAKCYIKSWMENNIEKTDMAIAGLPKDARKSITFDNLKDGLKIKQAKKVKCKVKGGIIIRNVDFTIKV